MCWLCLPLARGAVAPIGGLTASDSRSCLTPTAQPSLSTHPGSSHCWHSPAPEHPAIHLPSRPLSQLSFSFLSLRYRENQCPLYNMPYSCPHGLIWATRAKPCKSANSCTATSPNPRCPFEYLHFPFLSPGASWVPSYLTHPALSPLRYKPCKVYIRSPTRLSSSGAEDVLYSSVSQQSPGQGGAQICCGRMREGWTDRSIAKGMNGWVDGWTNGKAVR